ncbi:MAG: fatty acid desaturase [Coxiella sp. RIFCSPHIGHO2_12_FULL_44_14]|nr:MAG: fatty acid desaturase [Coxiella sp. RIFCSPHIGHO2_12_FULL_44_14]
MNILRRINWVNTLFLLLTPVIGVGGMLWLLSTGSIQWATWVWAGVYLWMTGLSVTAGYHRLFSHQTYRAVWPLRLAFLLLASATFEGSALEWSTDHRNHHRYTDTDKDPYSIRKGFWYAHMGWLFMLDARRRDFSNVTDLSADRIVSFQHRFFVPLAVIMGFGIPAAVAALWGDAWGGFIIAGALRMAVNHQFTFCINSVCHYFGKRTYSDQQSARDHWVTAFFTYGEGYHNFHHQFSLDYRNGVRLFHMDPTKWLIYGLSRVGLAYHLRRVSTARIIRYRLQMDEKQLMGQSLKRYGSLKEPIETVIHPVREGILRVLSQMEKLENEYRELRASRLSNAWSKAYDPHVRLKEYRQRLKAMRQELKSYRMLWTQLIKRPLSYA